MLAFIRTLMVPDPAVEWLPSALYNGNKLLRSNSYDVIVSAGYPFTAHVLGYLLKRLNKTAWVAEYGDPWAFNPASQMPWWRSSLDKILEGTLLRRADGVVVTNENTRVAYLQHYPFLRPDRVWSLPSGYAPEEYESASPPTFPKFRLVYTGVFYRDIRSPDSFLAAVEQLADLDIEFVVAGPGDYQLRGATPASVLRRLQWLGNVPRSQAISLQKSASLLVLVGNSTPLCLPLKVFEYIGARRPILCVRNGDDDMAAGLLQPLRRGLVVDNRPECIAAGIRSAYELWRHGDLDRQFDLRVLEQYTWSRVAAKMDAHLSSI